MVYKKMTGNSENNANRVIYTDLNDEFNTTGVVVDNVAYDTGKFLDRDYDIRGFLAFGIDLKNIGTTDVVYTILTTNRQFEDFGDLKDADFDKVEVSDTDLESGDDGESFNLLGLYPLVTAIRLQIKLKSAGDSSKIRGIVRAA